MAFVVPTKRGRFEVRESHATPDGPRSRTLASFKEMNEEVTRKAQARTSKPLSAEELRRSALRAGAPVALSAVDEAGREALRRLSRGERMEPVLRRLLLDALSGQEGEREAPAPAPISDTARAASEWIGADPEERGRALRDLLELTDALPLRLPASDIGFPRLSSA